MGGSLRKSILGPTWKLRGLIAFFACAAAFWAECVSSIPFTRLDEAARDAFLQINASERIENRIAVIDIGEDALVETEPWPWKRSTMANLATSLLDYYGAQAVAFDIVFVEKADSEGDNRLARLASSAPLTFAQILDFSIRDQSVAQGVLSGGIAFPNAERISRASGFIANHAGLSKARCVGNIGYSPDIDGVLRRIPLFAEYRGIVVPHLSLALLSCVLPNIYDQLRLEADARLGSWRIPYRYKLSSYTVISAAEILSRSVPRNLVEGRYVLIGSSALGLGDRVSTPLSPLSAGVMVHAASLSGLLDILEGTSRPARSGRVFVLFWIVVSVAVATAIIVRFSALMSILALISIVLVWLALAFIGTVNQMEGSISAPLLAYFALLTTAIPYEWWRSQRSARRLLNTFSHYVAKPVLNELVRMGESYSLTPTLRDVTVLIADMEGYTKATSLLSLEDAAALTKDFLDRLTRPVLARHGTLDKYTGDGLVAFWGAPLVCPDQADQAISAALEILEAVDLLNRTRHESGARPIRVRIGIESGKALVGDLGTPFRSTYTAVGDCINFASRLEVAARDLPVQIVIGPITNSLLRRHKTVSLGRHTLRGTLTEIDLFSVQT